MVKLTKVIKILILIDPESLCAEMFVAFQTTERETGPGAAFTGFLCALQHSRPDF